MTDANALGCHTMRIQHQYKMHGYDRDMLGNAHIANNPLPFHVGIRFPDMNIQVVSVAKLRRKYRPCDRYSRRSLSGQKDSPRIILSDNIVRFGSLSMLEAQGTSKSHWNHYGERPQSIPNSSDNKQ